MGKPQKGEIPIRQEGKTINPSRKKPEKSEKKRVLGYKVFPERRKGKGTVQTGGSRPRKW